STVDEALAQLRMTDKAPVAASRGSRLPLDGMALPVVSPKNVQLDDAGVLSTVRLAAPTVAALLDAAGAPLQQSDSVVPAPSTPLA
ncbi:resuscitation-promoting factor, partial [Mycobacterium sp. ITM-2017-0098]